jgi:hypothetical protein
MPPAPANEDPPGDEMRQARPFALFPPVIADELIDSLLIDGDSSSIHSSCEFALTLVLSGFGPADDVVEALMAALLAAGADRDADWIHAVLRQLITLIPPDPRHRFAWFPSSAALMLGAVAGCSVGFTRGDDAPAGPAAVNRGTKRSAPGLGGSRQGSCCDRRRRVGEGGALDNTC